MKKPKFDQLRGTSAHSLRHRICLAVTIGVMSVGYIMEYGLTKLNPEPGKKMEDSRILKKFARLDPTKKKVLRGEDFDDTA